MILDVSQNGLSVVFEIDEDNQERRASFTQVFQNMVMAGCVLV